MIKERLQVSFFERVSKIILGRIPAFFSRSFVRERDLQEFSEFRHKGVIEPTGKKIMDKRTLESLHAEEDMLQFKLKFNEAEIRILDAFNIKEGRKIKGQEALNLCYIAQSNFLPKTDDSDRLRSQESVYADLLKIMHQFNLAGKKIFRIEEALQNELVLTDCKKVDDSFFQLPFDSICLHLPFNTSIKSRSFPIEWVFITQIDFEDRSDFEFFCITKNNTFYNEKFFLDGGDIYSQIKQQVLDKFGGSKLAIQENTELFSFITSVILYLNTGECDQTHISPDASPFKIPVSRIPVCSLGRNIVINNDFHYHGEGDHAERIFHVLKWTVRGHFRKQKCGSGRFETKIIWIRPFLKGREKTNELIPAKPANYKMK